jgi:hypothetical protein
VLFEATRPILLNGIEDAVNRPDLGDRAIFLTLPPIGDAQRRPEIARSHILGALLDAAVQASGQWVLFTSTGSRAWQIPRSGPRLL